MKNCTQCSVAPQSFPTEGSFVLTGVDPEESHRLTESLAPYGIAPVVIGEGVLQFEIFPGVSEIALEWAILLSDRLREEARYVILPAGETPSFSNISKSLPIAGFIQQLKNAWVLEMIRENRFNVHFQPIVEAASPDRIFANECLMRGIGITGEMVYPGSILDAADDEGLVFHLDRLCRLNAIAAFAKQKVSGKAFINFNPVSIYNPVACLQSTVIAAREGGLTPDRIVFELIERDHVADEVHLLRIVDFYRAAGYGIALDDVGAGHSGLNLLTALKPDYMKLDMNLIRNVDSDPVRQGVVGNMLEMGRKLGIQTIAEGVETEAEYHFVKKEGADFVQGYLFGRPAARATETPWPLAA